MVPLDRALVSSYRMSIVTISPITSLQPWKLHLDIGYVPPTDTGSLCLAVDSTDTVVSGLF